MTENTTASGAAPAESAPLQQGEYLPLPEPAVKACHCYSTNQVREAIDADRAARGAAQAAPQQGEYLPLTQADVDRIVPVLEPVNGARHPVEWSLWNDRKRIRAELGAHIASRGAAQPEGGAK